MLQNSLCDSQQHTKEEISKISKYAQISHNFFWFLYGLLRFSNLPLLDSTEWGIITNPLQFPRKSPFLSKPSFWTKFFWIFWFGYSALFWNIPGQSIPSLTTDSIHTEVVVHSFIEMIGFGFVGVFGMEFNVSERGLHPIQTTKWPGLQKEGGRCPSLG